METQASTMNTSFEAMNVILFIRRGFLSKFCILFMFFFYIVLFHLTYSGAVTVLSPQRMSVCVYW